MKSPILHNTDSNFQNAVLVSFKAQIRVQRFAELRALNAVAQCKANAALQAETAASAGFILAVVEMSGAVQRLPAGA